MIDAKPEDGQETRLAALSSNIKGLRDEAIKGRLNSGIEQQWREDDEYYEGIDDSNRAAGMLKPTTSDGRMVKQRKPKGSRSTVFLNITRQFVNAAAAHVADKLIPNDMSNFRIRPTPLPRLIEDVKSTEPAMDGNGQQVTMPDMDADGNQQEQPHIVNGQPMIDQATGQPVMTPVTKPATVGDIAKEKMAKAKVASEKALVQIEDWLNECGSNGQNRQIIKDAARIGTGVLKGPYPEMVRKRAVVDNTMVVEEKIVPVSRRISVWNLWPDPSCGEDVHRGKFLFENDEINARKLNELKKDPSYIHSAICNVLEQGPTNSVTGASKREKNGKPSTNELYEIWYFNGFISGQDLIDCGYEFEDEPESQGLMDAMPEHEMPDGEVMAGEAHGMNAEGMTDEYAGETHPEGVLRADTDISKDGLADEGYQESEPEEDERLSQQFPVIATMVNDVIIKATLSPFDTGKYPYQIMRWQYKSGTWAGDGVGRQMRTSQNGINSSARMMHDNAGATVRPTPIINRRMIEPVDGVTWTIGAGNAFYTTPEYDGDDVRKAITWIATDSRQNEMMNMINFYMGMAEKETGLPALLQGQQDNFQATKGEIQIRNNNGNALLRSITNVFDDDVTRHHINGYYEWLLIHGEDDSMKGDFTIDTLGASVLIERDAQAQTLSQMLPLSLQPAFGADPEMVYKEFLLSQRFEANKLMLSDEKKAERAKQQPPADPRIEVAKMRSADLQAATQTKIAFETQQSEIENALRQYELNLQAQTEANRASGNREMNAETLKSGLAKEAMKLRVAIQLAMQNARAKDMPTPAIEPPGRALPGNSYQS